MLKFGENPECCKPNASVDQGSLNVGLLEVYVLPQASSGCTSDEPEN